MKRSEAYHPWRATAWTLWLIAATSCAPHASGAGDGEADPSRAADSARSAQTARSRSSASQVIDFTEEERSHYSRVEQMIQAKFSGVQVIATGSGYTIRIRGSGSFTSGNDPLVIIDGASRSVADLRSVSTVDVKRIEVVKDAAGSFYGSRGANGVILVTTGRER